MSKIKQAIAPLAKTQLAYLLVALLLIIAIAFLGSYFINSSDAARRTSLPIGLYIGNGSSRITPDSTMSVTIYENSGQETVNSVQAKLVYDAKQLQYYGIAEGSAFPVVAATDVSTPGVVQIARGVAAGSAGVSYNNAVATVKFKVLPDVSGTVVLSFDSQNSFLVRSSDSTNILSGVVGGTYKVSSARGR